MIQNSQAKKYKVAETFYSTAGKIFYQFTLTKLNFQFARGLAKKEKDILHRA